MNKPSRWCHLASVLIFLFGGIGVPIFLVFSLVSLSSNELGDFYAPGSITLHLKRSVSYGLWIFTSERRDGKIVTGELTNGFATEVTETSTGRTLPLRGGLNSTERSDDTELHSICEFEAPVSGDYQIRVSNVPQKTHFAIKKGIMEPIPVFNAKSIIMLIFAIILSFLGWVLPIVISVFVEVKRNIAEKQNAP